ncbi:hypothetical protein DFH08DRAFT_817852 [Mycena albidolilacea]|uniref:Uncharacterized protein n=1 Tax=Mycena albidolilacea TaxID=1033008 RepID=A0AAD7EI89_9AGAR|nr:hypothetical protein DFH08DRAFT_817852 [Mycena albidolilacea]
MTNRLCRVLPGRPEVAVLWLCISNLLHNFFKTVPFEAFEVSVYNVFDPLISPIWHNWLFYGFKKSPIAWRFFSCPLEHVCTAFYLLVWGCYLSLALFGVYMLKTYELPGDHRFKPAVELALQEPRPEGYGKDEKAFIVSLFLSFRLNQSWARTHPAASSPPSSPSLSPPPSLWEGGSLSPQPRLLSTHPRSLSLTSSTLPSDPLSDSDSDISIMSSAKPVLATVTHPKSDRCPILEAGTITPEILQQWRRACQKYLKNCKDRTADDLVSYVADEMREPILQKWYLARQSRIDGLKLEAYLAELGSLVLEKGWEGKMRRQVLGVKMKVGQTFADWAYDTQNINAILSQAASTFAVDDKQLKNILDAGLTEVLQQDLDTEPVLSSDLNAWIAEVKGRDDRLRFETARMQTLINANRESLHSKTKGKVSLADHLTTPKPSLASRLSSPPPVTVQKCPPLTDGEKTLLDLHDGCRRCRQFYIGHRTLNCDGVFPDAATYWTLTQADAVAQADARGKTLKVKREPAAAAHHKSKDILSVDYEESESDPDGYVLPPLTVPHLYVDVTLSGPSISEFPIPVRSLLDIGCHSIVISDKLVTKLGLRQYPLPVEEDNLSSLSDSPLSCQEYVKLKVSSGDGNWTSSVVRAKVNIGLCIPLILGMPFLASEHILIDPEQRTAVDKRTGFDLLNNPSYPPHQWKPEWVTPPPTPKKPKHKPLEQEPIPFSCSTELPVSVMLDVKNRIDELALQKLLQDEDARLKTKHADVFPIRLPDNTDDLPDNILH